MSSSEQDWLSLSRGPAAMIFLILISVLGAPKAKADAKGCVADYMATLSVEGEVLEMASEEADGLIAEVSRAIGLSSTGIHTIPCYDLKRAATVDPSAYGYYVVYNPDWIMDVMGADRWQKVAILAHELAHYLDGHFDRNKPLSRLEKEVAADYFAGCAVGTMRGEWSSVESVYSRIRRDVDIDYPNRLESLQKLREGFDNCRGAPVESLISVEPDITIGQKYGIETVFEVGDGYGYVYLGQYFNGSWTGANFSGVISYEPEELFWREISSVGEANLRASIPISRDVMGSLLERLTVGESFVVTNIIVYGGRDEGHTWAQVKLDSFVEDTPNYSDIEKG